MGMRFVGTFGIVAVGMVVRGRANRNWNDCLVGYTAAVSLGEHDQALQNTLEQGIDGRAGDGRHGGSVGARV